MSGYYVRHNRTVPFESRVFAGIGAPCAACGAPVEVKDETILVPVGPGADPDERRKAYRGKWYNAVAVVVHRACGEGAAS